MNSSQLCCSLRAKPLEITERFHFHRRNQQSGETIADYIATLRKLALHCEFEEYLDQALQDRLVCGLLSEHIQKRLLPKPIWMLWDWN